MRQTFFRSALLSLLSSSCLIPAAAHATPPQTIEATPTQYRVNGDGSLVYSYFTDGSGNGVLWTPSTGNVVIGDLAGGAVNATIYGALPDGSAAVGTGDDGGPWQRAFYWSVGSGFTTIPDLPGATGWHLAKAISGDGSTVAGTGMNASGQNELFLWTPGGGTVGLGFDAGWTDHHAFPLSINYDGTALAGTGNYMGASHWAYHWDTVNGMTAIPLLPAGVNPSAYNEAYAISGDGTAVVGYNEYMGTGGQAFYWTQATGVIGMGYLGTDDLSSATLVNYDGSMAYGYSFGSGFTGGTAQAFRWTQATGPVSIDQIMSDAGIDMTDFSTGFIYGASNDGTYLTGLAHQFSLGSDVTFMANLNAAALTTPDDVIQSVISTPTLQEQATQKTMSQIGQSLFAARLHSPLSMGGDMASQSFASFNPATPQDIAPAAGDSVMTRQPIRIAGYVVGSLNAGQDNDLDNWGVNGTAGFKFGLSDDLTIGIGLNGSDTETKGIFDSHTQLVSKGGSILTSYEPDSGLRLYSSLFAAGLSIDTHRGYAVAGGEEYSDGKTDGTAVGVALRAGWEMPLSEDTSIQPYLEAHMTKVKVDPYTETTGAFPASFSEQSEVSRLGKIGVELQHQFSPALRLSTQVAVVHMPTASSSAVQTTVGGLTFATTGTLESDPNWVEGTVGAQWAVSDQLQLTAEVNSRTGHTQTPQVAATFGLSYNF